MHRHLYQFINGQSYKLFLLVNYDTRVIITSKLLIFTALESLFMLEVALYIRSGQRCKLVKRQTTKVPRSNVHKKFAFILMKPSVMTKNVL